MQLVATEVPNCIVASYCHTVVMYDNALYFICIIIFFHHIPVFKTGNANNISLCPNYIRSNVSLLVILTELNKKNAIIPHGYVATELLFLIDNL